MEHAESLHLIRLLGKNPEGKAVLASATQIFDAQVALDRALGRLPLSTRLGLASALADSDCEVAGRLVAARSAQQAGSGVGHDLGESLALAGYSARMKAATLVRRRNNTRRWSAGVGSAVAIDAPLLAMQGLHGVITSTLIGLWLAVPGLTLGAVAGGLLPLARHEAALRDRRLSETMQSAHELSRALDHGYHVDSMRKTDVSVVDGVGAVTTEPVAAALVISYGPNLLDTTLRVIDSLNSHEVDLLVAYADALAAERVAQRRLQHVLKLVDTHEDADRSVTWAEVTAYDARLQRSQGAVSNVGLAGTTVGLAAMTTTSSTVDLVVGSAGVVGSALAMFQRRALGRRREELTEALDHCLACETRVATSAARAGQPFAEASVQMAEDPRLLGLAVDLAVATVATPAVSVLPSLDLSA